MEQSEFQAALDNEADLTIDPATTINLTSIVSFDQITVQTVDFNNSTIEKNFDNNYAFIINKGGLEGTLTTIKNVDIDGNSRETGLIYILGSRTNMENVEIHHAVENTFSGGPRGIYLYMDDRVGAKGEYRWDNVDIHDIRNDARALTAQPTTGWATALEVVWTEQVTGTGAQFVWLNGDVYNIWGDEGDGIRLSSNAHEVTGNNTLWFENMYIRECERSAVKNYLGNCTWINSTIQAVDRTNSNIDLISNPASLFRIGARSGALGSNNNLFCGVTFANAPTTPNDAWDVEISINGDVGKNGAGVEFRNCTFESGDDPSSPPTWMDYYGMRIAGEINDFKICNSTIGIASTAARGMKMVKVSGFALQAGAKLEIDSNNTYTNSEAKFVEDFTVTTEYVISDLSGDCATCPTEITGGGVSVTGVNVYPTTDKMEATNTRDVYARIAPSNATDLTGTWTTSNALVATVSPVTGSNLTGTVTGVGTGTATITFTANDGSFTDTCVVTVEASNSEDSIMILGPQGYYTPTSGDADSWDDTSGFELHGTEVGTITFTDQAAFDGSSYYDISNSEFLDYKPTIDEYTLIFREGDTSPTSGYPLSKNGGSGLIQYGFVAYNSTINNMNNIYNGNLGETLGEPTLNNNRLCIAVIQTNSLDVWVDGAQVITGSSAIGSQLTTASPNIGGYGDGNFMLNNGATLDIVATIPYAISTAEREAIETEFIVNTPPSVDNSTKPTGALNSDPVYFLGTTKKLLKGN